VLHHSVQPGAPVFLPETDEIVDRPVIGFFGTRRKIAGRQLAASAVVVQAIAAYGLLAAGVTAIAVLAVPFFITFHDARDFGIRLWLFIHSV
jgi:hypothetical protein